MCAITDFKVNYTPENTYSTLTDSFPVAVEIKISFLETKLVFADDVDPNIALNGTIAYDSEGKLHWNNCSFRTGKWSNGK